MKKGKCFSFEAIKARRMKGLDDVALATMHWVGSRMISGRKT